MKTICLYSIFIDDLRSLEKKLEVVKRVSFSSSKDYDAATETEAENMVVSIIKQIFCSYFPLYYFFTSIFNTTKFRTWDRIFFSYKRESCTITRVRKKFLFVMQEKFQEHAKKFVKHVNNFTFDRAAIVKS